MRSKEWVWLTVILVTGLALRLYRLGALGLAGDEDYLALTVRSILVNGIPDLPSGVFYPRALPLSYLTAGLVALFGTSEAVLRLPSVLFSMLSIAGVYLLGRRWISPRVALLAALFMAVSNWEVEVGRFARMYEMLSASCLLSLVFLARAIERRSRGAAVAAAGCGLLAAFTHQIAFALVLMYACFLLYPKPDRWRVHLLVCLIAVVALGGIVNLHVEDSQYGKLGAGAGAEPVSQEAPEPSDREDPPNVSTVEVFSSRFLLPFLTLRGTHHGAFLAATALGGSMLLALALALAMRARDGLFALASALLVLTLYLQQLLAAAMVLMAYLLVDRVRKPIAVRRRSLLLGLIVLAASMCWVLYWLFAGPAAATLAGGDLLLGAKQLLKPLIGYPKSFLRFYLERYPVMSALAGVGCLVAGIRFWRTRRVEALGVVVLLFAVPAVALGFHPTALREFGDRLIFFVDPYFALLVAFGATWIAARLADALPVGRRPGVSLVGLYALGILLFGGLPNARASLAVVTAEYGVGKSGFHPDVAGPAQFVRVHYRPSDIVIPMDILPHYAYFPVAHYQLYQLDKPEAGWIGVPLLASAEDLAGALARHRGARVWIVLDAVQLRRREHDPRMKAILRLIASRAGKPRYRGRDGLSDVYLVEPRAAGGGQLRSHGAVRREGEGQALLRTSVDVHLDDPDQANAVGEELGRHLAVGIVGGTGVAVGQIDALLPAHGHVVERGGPQLLALRLQPGVAELPPARVEVGGTGQGPTVGERFADFRVGGSAGVILEGHAAQLRRRRLRRAPPVAVARQRRREDKKGNDADAQSRSHEGAKYSSYGIVEWS
ncbi:MAG: glycosyltransferase family 39 protein [Thermoanaerobaculia bacterium]